jgi:hypothetical protein
MDMTRAFTAPPALGFSGLSLVLGGNGYRPLSPMPTQARALGRVPLVVLLTPGGGREQGVDAAG